MNPFSAGTCIPIALATLIIACSSGDNGAAPSPTATETATITPAPTATPAPSPPPAPTPVVPCPGGPEASEAALSKVSAYTESVMQNYKGSWGLALLDLDCDTILEVNPGHLQYAASAGKIISVIAALRTVESGALPMEAVQGHVEAVMLYSSDERAHTLDELAAPGEARAVVDLAGYSPTGYWGDAWNMTWTSAAGLARVWAALVRGDLLSDAMTEWVLDLAAQADVPRSHDTFPADYEIPGYQWGQKAGYYVHEGVPYHLAGAGYIRPRHAETNGVVAVFLLETDNPDLLDPQRRAVFPAIVDYVLRSSDGHMAASGR